MRGDDHGLEHVMDERRTFAPSSSPRAHVPSFSEYQRRYRRSIEENDTFWLEEAAALRWMQLPTQACRWEWDSKQRIIDHTWFADGTLNVCDNCVDRYKDSDKAAIIWQGEEADESCTLSYRDLYSAVCTCAAALQQLGIGKGDRVILYMPMIPELAIATLACARLGAIHSVVFGGFSVDSLTHRIQDSEAKLVITANSSIRAGKRLPFKETVDQALHHCSSVEHVLVVKRLDEACAMTPHRDLWYHKVTREVAGATPAPIPLAAEDPLFILYTSGSTGKPKGIVHSQAGYLLYAALTHRLIFDIHDDDIYWCTADIGWITGHSYVIYGPLANGATTLMFEGVPTYPNPGRFWQIIETFGVTAFYTAPTAIRALISHGESWPKQYDLTSLRVIGTVGEPINPETWIWYHTHIGGGTIPIVDTWWQTETGGIMITPLPGSHTLKPGSATRPFFGIDPLVLKDDATPCTIDEGGSLCIRRPWPGIMRTMWGNHDLFIDTYFSQFNDLYFSGDGCRIDSDGDYWLLGRIDDVVNISGHRLGTAEIESALVSHPAVAEAAVVPIPHTIKGQSLYAFVTPVDDANPNDNELRRHVRKEVGPIAVPDTIQLAAELPKTRSGKIMRRLLRKIAEGSPSDLGDLTTLADATVIETLLQDRPS